MEQNDTSQEWFVSNSLQVLFKIMLLRHQLDQRLYSLRSGVGQINVLKSELRNDKLWQNNVSRYGGEYHELIIGLRELDPVEIVNLVVKT